MGYSCFIPTENKDLADKIVALSPKKKNYNSMAALSTVFPYILDKGARNMHYDNLEKIDSQEILNRVEESWVLWEPYIKLIMKALDAFTSVEFRTVQSIVNNRQTDENSYNHLLNNYDLVDHKLADVS